MKYFFVLIIPMLIACQSFKNKLPITQGIKGLVYSHSGNMMPGAGRSASPGKVMSATLYIYQPTTAQQAEGASPQFTKINSKLITIVKTNSNGAYAVYLPAGSYSIFIKDDKGYFANESDGNGIINPVEVKTEQVTERDWTLARGAVY